MRRRDNDERERERKRRETRKESNARDARSHVPGSGERSDTNETESVPPAGEDVRRGA